MKSTDIFKYSENKKSMNITSFKIENVFKKIKENSFKTMERKSLKYNFIGNDVEINSDESVITNILEFLIDTSIDYSPDGSNIEIKCFIDSENHVVLEVYDSGRSYSESDEEIEMLFNPWQQTIVREKSLRTGKGFNFPYISSVLKIMSGKISFTNTPRTGAIIKFKNGV